MRPSHTLRAAAVFAAAIVGFGTITSAQQQDQQQQSQPQQTTPDRTHEHSQQQLEQTKRIEQSEMHRHGDRKVEVREMALWSLGELPPHLMHRAMEHLADDPQEARKAVMAAANIIELQASLAIQKAETHAVQQQEDRHEPVTGNDRISSREGAAGSSSSSSSSSSASAEAGRGIRSYQAASGGDWSHTRDQGLWRAAEELRDLAMRIEYRQVLTRDELRQPFERASIAMASFYQRAAKEGFDRQDPEETGYTLKGAADYLAAAHAFGQQRPTAATSRALFDADRLGEQIIKLSKPTTVQPHNGSATNTPAEGEPNTDTARPAAARQTGAAAAVILPQETGQAITNLGDAIRQAESRQGVAGHSVGQPQDRRNDQDRSTDQGQSRRDEAQQNRSTDQDRR
jgi:hypothetical protein